MVPTGLTEYTFDMVVGSSTSRPAMSVIFCVAGAEEAEPDAAAAELLLALAAVVLDG